MGLWIVAGSQIAEAAALLLAAEGTAQRAELQAALPRSDHAGDGIVVDLQSSGGEKVILRSPDGLFYLIASVNGAPVRFLVDTGATTIVLNATDAARAGVLPPPAAFHHSAQTAGGVTAMARVRLARLSVGLTERRDVDAAITQGGLAVSLLGQSWLSQMGSVTISGDRMVLRDEAADLTESIQPESAAIWRGITYAEFDFRSRLPRGADTKKRLRIAPEPQYFLRA